MSEPQALGHRYEDALAYAQDFLSDAERAEYEAHLATCTECQASLAYARKFLPAFNEALQMEGMTEALSAPPPLTPAQLLANVRAEFARVQEAQAASGFASWFKNNWLTFALAGAGVAAVLAFLWMRPPQVPPPDHDANGVLIGPRPDHLYGPVAPRHRQLPDGGDAG